MIFAEDNPTLVHIMFVQGLYKVNFKALSRFINRFLKVYQKDVENWFAKVL